MDASRRDSVSGARGDAQGTLHHVSDTARHNPSITVAGVRPEVLAESSAARSGHFGA